MMASCQADTEPLAVKVKGISRLVGCIAVTLKAGLDVGMGSGILGSLLRLTAMPKPISTINVASRLTSWAFEIIFSIAFRFGELLGISGFKLRDIFYTISFPAATGCAV